MAKAKKVPITQTAAEALTEVEATLTAIKDYEVHEAECIRQLEEANRIADEWRRALGDTQSLLHAQREKLERECSRLHRETGMLHNKYGMRNMPATAMRNEVNPF